MKIYLILPAAEQLRVTKKRSRVTRRKMLRFSLLSLTTIAALTPEDHEVIICDENVEPVDYQINADVVGITFMTGLANRAYELARHYKGKGIITVAGGFHPTLNPEEAGKHFNIVVQGEAEDTWPRVLSDIEKGSFKPCYKSRFKKNLDHVPRPRQDLIKNPNHYITTDTVQTGRGCNHTCKFCSVTAFFNHQHRSRPLSHVLDEVKSAGKTFMFVDDNIIADREFALSLFKNMARMKKKWVSQCSIKIADDDELLEMAAKAGCIGLFIGIESVSKANLETVGKGFNNPDGYMAKIRKINKAGIGVQAGMIVGLDSDDIHVFEQNLEFLQKAGIGALQLAVLTPQPGTPLRKQYEKQGRIIDSNWDHYDFRHTVIQPEKMTPEELQNGADWLYAQYYRLDRIVMRTIGAFFRIGLYPAVMTWKLNMTYRYDIKRLNIKGKNPAARNKNRVTDIFKRFNPRPEKPVHLVKQ